MEELEKQIHLIKEDLLTEIRNVENRLASAQNDGFNEIERKLTKFNNTLYENTERVNTLQDFHTLVKVKIFDNYAELNEFSKNAQDELLSLDRRLNNMQKDMKTSTAKYDKIFVDNMLIPGTIGDYCKYKTLREYIEVSLLTYIYKIV